LKKYPVWQWLGIIVGIAIALLLTLSLLFCVQLPQHATALHIVPQQLAALLVMLLDFPSSCGVWKCFSS